MTKWRAPRIRGADLSPPLHVTLPLSEVEDLPVTIYGTPDEPDPVTWTQTDAQVAEVRRLLKLPVLTTGQKHAVASILAGKRPIDIARELHISKPTVTVMLHRATDRLRAAHQIRAARRAHRRRAGAAID